jgi:hypothetical protein
MSCTSRPPTPSNSDDEVVPQPLSRIVPFGVAAEPGLEGRTPRALSSSPGQLRPEAQPAWQLKKVTSCTATQGWNSTASTDVYLPGVHRCALLVCRPPALSVQWTVILRAFSRQRGSIAVVE